MSSDGPKKGQEDFLLLPIQTLSTFWAERIWILRFVLFDPKLLDFQVPRSPNSQISRSPDLQILRFPNYQISRFPDFQMPPPDELSDPNLTPLPTHPGIKYVARALAAIFFDTRVCWREVSPKDTT